MTCAGAPTLPAAKVLAHRTNRMLIVLVPEQAIGTDNWLIRMLANPAVAPTLGHFVLTSVGSDKDIARFRMRYDLSLRASIVYMSVRGSMTGKTAGLVWPSMLVESMNMALNGDDLLPKLRRKVAANPRDGASLCSLASYEAFRGDIKGARTLLEAAEHARARRQDLCDAYAWIGESYRSGPRLDLSLPYFKKSLDLAETPMQKFRGLLRYGVITMRIKNYAEGVKVLDKVLSVGPVPEADRVAIENFLGAARRAR